MRNAQFVQIKCHIHEGLEKNKDVGMTACEHSHASSADRCECGWQGVDIKFLFHFLLFD